MYGYVIYLYLITCADAVKDMCDGSDARIVYKAVYNDSGEIHCFFQPPKDSAVPIILPSNGVDIVAARDQCRKYEAGLLQIKDANMYVFVMRQGVHGIPRGSRGQKMVLCEYQYAWFPLGIRNYSYHPKAPTINVTWDNGVQMALPKNELYDLSNIYTPPELNLLAYPAWETPEDPGEAYLMMGDGQFKTANETESKRLVELLCHQDPNYPITTSRITNPLTSQATASTRTTSNVGTTFTSQAPTTLNNTLITISSFAISVLTRLTTEAVSTGTKLKSSVPKTTGTIAPEQIQFDTKSACSDVKAEKKAIILLLLISIAAT